MDYIIRDKNVPSFRERRNTLEAAKDRANVLNKQWASVGFKPHTYLIYYNGTGELVTTVDTVPLLI